MNIKQKFLIGFGILLLAIGITGVVMLRQVDKLGRAVDVILRENYRSVIICQEVNEALERIDSGLLASLSAWPPERSFFDEQIEKIRQSWAAELENITVVGEGERAEKVRQLLTAYFAVLPKVIDSSTAAAVRRELYRTEVHPLFLSLKKEINGILLINQDNMSDANNLARIEAVQLHRQGIAFLGGCIIFVLAFSLILTRWIQRPLKKLIAMTDEIANGNLALALDSKSNDEIGQLSRSFNAMTIALRNAQSQLVGKLHRSERMNKDVFSELPTPIVVFDIKTERIEVTTKSAEQYFGLTEGKRLEEFSFDWLREIFAKVRSNGIVGIAGKNDGMIQHFIEGREYFFQPTAVPVPTGVPPEQITAVAVILKDVTMAHEQQELKRSVISTVSHQLKTPLTSLQMSIYLLLEEKCGALNPDQLDLVMAMRDDSQRLTDIIGDLLDLNKVSKSGALPVESHSPNELLLAARDRFLAECQNRAVKLEIQCDPLASPVAAVLNRVNYAFDNLIGNAIRFTPPGGTITLTAKALEQSVQFQVIDTGSGMSEEVREHIFEPFYRGPGQDSASGVGLGLAIAKEIITAHGGSIEAASNENAGSVFTFTLPTAGGKEI